MAQNTIDYVFSFVILVGVLIFSITTTMQVLNNSYSYQTSQQINAVATDLLNNLLQNTGYPANWGELASSPSNFGLRWSQGEGTEPSPFSPIRIMNSTNGFSYAGKTYTEIGTSSTSISIKDDDRVPYSKASALLGTIGNFGWRVTYTPVYDIKVEKTLGPSSKWYKDNSHPNYRFIYRKAITIDATGVIANLIDYPLLVSFTSSDLQAHVQSSGNDILFTDSDFVTKLDHELENYDPSTGTVTAWVRVPLITAGSTQKIYIYYGDPTVPSQQNPTGVWASVTNPTINYKFVSHMKNDPDSTQIADSTSSNLDGTKYPTGNPSTEITSQIYKAQSFDGVDDYIQMPSTTIGSGEITYEMWLNSVQAPTTQSILSDGIRSQTVGFTDISRPASSDDLKFDYAPYDGWNSKTTNPAGTSITCTAYFKSNVYGGGADGKLYQWNGIDTWAVVANQLGSEGITSLTVFNLGSDKLYAGTTPNGKLYQWDIGYTSWVQVAPTMKIKCLIKYSVDNKIYGGTDDGRLLQWDSTNLKWVQVAAQFGIETSINCLTEYNPGTGSKLYAGTSPNGKLYQWDSVSSWVQIADRGVLNINSVLALTVFNNKIFGGTDSVNLCSWIPSQTSWSLEKTATGQTSIPALAKLTSSYLQTFSFTANSGSWTNGGLAVSSNNQYASHSPSIITLTNSPSANSGVWNTPTNAYDNSGNAATSSSIDQQQIYSGYGFSIPSGAIITSVRVRLDAWSTGSGSSERDDMRLEAYDGSSWLGTTSLYDLPSSDSNNHFEDITLWTSWNPTKVNNIQVRVTHVLAGSNINTESLDWIPIEVQYYPSPVSQTFSSFFGTTPTGDNIDKVEVGIEGYTPGDEKINVEVTWNGGTTWSPIQVYTEQSPTDGNLITYLDFTGSTAWTKAQLTNANFQVRVTDVYVGSTASPSYIDYIFVRVTSSSATLYAATSPNTYVWTLTSSGTWTQVITNKYSSETSINSMLFYNNILYGCTSPGGYLVKQNSNSWTLVSNPPGTQKITTLLTDGTKIYGGTTPNGYLYSSTGAGWTGVVTSQYLAETTITILALDSGGNVVAGTSPDGMLLGKSGSSWVKDADTYSSETTIQSLLPFGSNLYGGTSPNGLLYQWDSTNLKWLTKASTFDSQTSINALASFSGSLYGGTSPNGELFQWNGSNTWIKKAGALNSQNSILSLQVFSGNLYGGTSPGGRLFQWDNSAAWVQKAAQLSNEASINSLSAFNGSLYGSTAPSGLLYKWDGSSIWQKMADQSYSQTSVTSLLVVGGTHLYGSTSPNGYLFEYLQVGGVRTVPNFFTGYSGWIQVTIVANYNTKSVQVYRNGVFVATITLMGSAIAPTNTPKYIGAFGSTSSFYQGGIDEVRVSKGSRPPQWISARWINEKTSSSFTSAGAEEDGRLWLTVIAIGPSGPIPNADVVLSLIHSQGGSGQPLDLVNEKVVFNTTDINGQISKKYNWTESGVHLYLAIAKVTYGGSTSVGYLFEHQAAPAAIPIFSDYENGGVTLVHSKDIDPSSSYTGSVSYSSAIIIPISNHEYRPVKLVTNPTGSIDQGAPATITLGAVKKTPGALLVVYESSDHKISSTLTPWDVGSLGLTVQFGGAGLDATNIVTKRTLTTVVGTTYEVKLELWKEGGS